MNRHNQCLLIKLLSYKEHQKKIIRLLFIHEISIDQDFCFVKISLNLENNNEWIIHKNQRESNLFKELVLKLAAIITESYFII